MLSADEDGTDDDLPALAAIMSYKPKSASRLPGDAILFVTVDGDCDFDFSALLPRKNRHRRRGVRW